MQEKARILIAEDNRIMRETLRMLLQKTYDVEAVDSGEACLEVLARSAKDLVLLDINMTGIDGYETCLRLRTFRTCLADCGSARLDSPDPYSSNSRLYRSKQSAARADSACGCPH